MAKTLLARLRSFPPRKFENFVFDLLILSGLRNPVWRTPGPDAGRDIEGEAVSMDMSENLTLERWYIECKRYRKSLDWPAVFEKLSYASNHNADFLLFVTTGVLTPRAKEEMSRRAAAKLRPILRVWDATLLGTVALRYPLLLRTYGLVHDAQIAVTSLLPLVDIASKSVQSAYGHAVMRDTVDPALEFAAAVVELIAVRAATSGELQPVRPFRRDRDLYPWCVLRGPAQLDRFDAYAFRTLLAGVRLFSQCREVEITRVGDGVCQLATESTIRSSGTIAAIGTVAVAGDLEVTINAKGVRVTSRMETRNGR